MSYDLGILRAEAIRLWLGIPRDDDENILERIFGDDHPSCAEGALRGLIVGWPQYSCRRRTKVLKDLKGLAEEPVFAAVMLSQLADFNRVEITGEDPPWSVFEALAPNIMRALPYNARFNDGRLFEAISSAARNLPASSMAEICEGWICWLERNAAGGRLPSDYSLGVGKILLSSTASEPETRGNMVERMLAIHGTGATVAFVADFVDCWEVLSPEERLAIRRKLNSGRSDDVWLQAAAITRSVVPEAVERAVLGHHVSLADGAEALLGTVPRLLLNAAIHVYSGCPQPLWWLGTHHGSRDVWEPVIELVARTPCHPLFELAWEHVAADGDGERVAKVVKSLGPEHADRMLDILIRIKVGCTGNYMPEAWASVLEMAKDDAERGMWLSRMAVNACAMLEDLSDVEHWLSNKQDYKKMLNQLSADVTVLLAVYGLERNGDKQNGEESDSTIHRPLMDTLENSPPRLIHTYGRILAQLDKIGLATNDVKDALESMREDVLEEMQEIKARFENEEHTLDGWVSP